MVANEVRAKGRYGGEGGKGEGKVWRGMEVRPRAGGSYGVGGRGRYGLGGGEEGMGR